MEKCTQCGAVTMAESELEEVVRSLDTEDAPTEWAPVEGGTEVMDGMTLTSEDSPTAVGSTDELPFHVESQPPPPRRQRGPRTDEFFAPPMLTEDWPALPNLSDNDRTEEAPRLTMPVVGSALKGEPAVDLSSLREAAAPSPAPSMSSSAMGQMSAASAPTPAPPSDFDDDVTRPAYPMEGTLEPADEVGPYVLAREERAQTQLFLAVGGLAVIVILAVGAVAATTLVPARTAETPALSEVITSSDGRVAVEVEEPSVADVLPPEPKRKEPTGPVIKVTKSEEPVAPVRGAVRRPVPVVVPVTAPRPTIQVTPKPAPSASASTGRSYSSLIQQGWSAVSSDPASAASAFRQALDLRVGDPEASYGLGYALWRQERQAEALPHLCLALRSGDEQTQREINGMLARSDLSCD
ncbi:MAG: hypothetical protein EP330_01345 [Deltaproteobacteria bacterium]|nr:MAG: hypothetical protein EP330_01345 [Deltaproteobacteria bacterium]